MKDFQVLMEAKILRSCNWNFNLPNGYDQLNALLKLSNGNYDFNKLINLASQCSLDLIFHTFPESAFSFKGCSQSEIYVSSLKAACMHFGWDQFFRDFISFLEEESL
jgi:hypothetical protein